MPTEAPPDSPLFATASVLASTGRSAPVVVVGLPRSGSTFLTHVLSSLDDWYVFDDLYFVQRVDTVKARGPLTPAQLEVLLHQLGWGVRARIRFEQNFEAPQCTWEDVDRMVECVRGLYRDRPVEWPELLEEWLTRLARHHGKHRWGWKTPQDFHNVERIAAAFPGARFIFLVRDPRRVMASFKYVAGQDGRPGQYHPWTYATYWRMATQAYCDLQADGRFPLLLVDFESMVADPNAMADRIGEFLGSTRSRSVAVTRTNSSFADGKRRDITPTEEWILRHVAGPMLERFGYRSTAPRIRVRDLPDLAKVSLRFAGYQGWRLATSKKARVQVGSFVRGLVPRRRKPGPR